jgi:hypothetical protein
MRPLAFGTLVLLIAATSASAQLQYVTRVPPHVDIIPSDAWLCRQVATNLEESTLLGTAILGRLESHSPTEWSTPIRFQHVDNRLGDAIAAFAIDGVGGVIYVSDTLDGSTLLHEGTHAMMLRLTPEDARLEMARVLDADSAGQIDPDIVDLARRSFTLSFTASANPDLWGLVPMVLTTAAFSDNSHTGTLARLVRATDSAAVRLEGNVRKGWGKATIADAYDVAANSHWLYAGFPRPASWTWRDERTFRLIGEVVAYERARRCALGS